jgi:hypothetical protein
MITKHGSIPIIIEYINKNVCFEDSGFRDISLVSGFEVFGPALKVSNLLTSTKNLRKLQISQLLLSYEI